MICHPNAKINLGLNVTERRPDGYHNLETVFYPIPLCDTLQFSTDAGTDSHRPEGIFPNGIPVQEHSTEDYTFRSGGIDIDCPPEQNLLIKGLRLIREHYALPHLYISLHKQIPSGAGLGGGSSDAAHTMKSLNQMFNLGLSDNELEERVTGLGADCPFFVRNRPVFATGIGNIFTPIGLSLSDWHLVLVKPDIFVSTKEAYARISPRRPETPITDIIRRPVEEWKDLLTNDFEEGVFALHPEIADIKARLYDQGAAYASMSGSGSSVFGLFRTVPEETDMRRLFPGKLLFSGLALGECPFLTTSFTISR